MTKAVIYLNPRSPASRRALRALQNQSVDIDVIDYLKHPFSAQKLKELLELLNINPLTLLKRTYKALSEFQLLPGNELVEVMAHHPEFIGAPIIIMDGKAKIADQTDGASNLFE